MQIAYLTQDQVNAAVATRMARRLGLTLVVLAVKDADQAVAADSLVLDLDHLPAECKSKLLFRAGGGQLWSGVSVHSYNLARSEVRDLRTAGVMVHRRLTAAALSPRAVSEAPASS